jgi:ABC-2 type transport system ATP-binding protein
VNVIEAQMLGKRYGHTWALHNCTLAVPSNRAVALVGPNGAGKTTLLHLAVGLTAASAGRVTVLDGLTPGTEAARVRIGFVAQDTPLYLNFSVEDTFKLVASLTDEWDDTNAQRRLAALDIPKAAKVGRLSGGQRAQVALAVALARHPEMLVLDEPVARLDPLARHEFMGTLMEAVAEEGISVVFSSHVVFELKQVCDYLIVLADGRLQVSDDVDHLLDTHRVLTGPSEQANQLSDRMPVVWAATAQRQARLLVRMSSHETPPDGWRAESTNLEELVLAYLHSPDASALDGPQPAGITTAQVSA